LEVNGEERRRPRDKERGRRKGRRDQRQVLIQHQLLHRNVKWFRGGLVFKAHRWLYHSTLGSRVIKKTEDPEIRSAAAERVDAMSARPTGRSADTGACSQIN